MKNNSGIPGHTVVDPRRGATAPSKDDEQVIDDILWSDCPEELYLMRMLAERQHDEGTVTDSIMGDSTVAGIFHGNNRRYSSSGTSIEGAEGDTGWTKFAPIAASVATEGNDGHATVGSSPSLVESYGESLISKPRLLGGSQIPKGPYQKDGSDPENNSAHAESKDWNHNQDEESLFTASRNYVPSEVDAYADNGEEIDHATRAGLSTLSGDTMLRYMRPQKVDVQWWIDAESITYANPDGTGTTGSSRQESGSSSNKSRIRRSLSTKPPRRNSTNGESGHDGCFSKVIRRLTDDDKIFRRVVIISVLFIVLFVSLSAAALVRSGAIVSSVSTPQVTAVPTFGPTGSPISPPGDAGTSESWNTDGFPASTSTNSPTAQPSVMGFAQVIGTTVYPTEIPTESSALDDPFRLVNDLIAERSPASTLPLAIQQSAQYRALQWAVDDLQGKILPSEDKIVQRWALAVVYYSLSGQSWANREGWMTSDDECSWFSSIASGQPVCDELGRFVRLHLEDNNLQGNLPFEIDLLAESLLEINLSRNVISGSVPTHFGMLTALRRLSLDTNQLSGFFPTELRNMFDIEHISFRQNQLEGSLPMEMSQMTTLRLLDLSENDFTGNLFRHIGDLANLEYLALDGNRLSGAVPAGIDRLSDLRLLELQFNNFSGTIPADICGQRSNGLSVLVVDCEKVTCECCDSC